MTKIYVINANTSFATNAFIKYLLTDFLFLAISLINNVFIPVTTYVDFTEYEFMVYNRWGLKVFSTTNVDEGWSGGNNEVGVYVYIVRYKTSKGEYIERKGSVTLLR